MPTLNQQKAQVAASLGSLSDDSYPEQLFCFDAIALASFLQQNSSFKIKNLPDNGAYPYIKGGHRTCTLNIEESRTTIWDTKCTWTFTIDPKSSSGYVESSPGCRIYENANTSHDVLECIQITVTCTLQASIQENPATQLANLVGVYGLNKTVLEDPLCLAWLMQIKPISIENNADAGINDMINTCFRSFFQQASASLFIPNMIAKSQEVNGYTMKECANKLGIAIASCMDADQQVKSHKVYVVIQSLADDGTVDRSQPSAPWVQQWCLPGSETNTCTAVLQMADVWTSFIEALDGSVEKSLMDELVEGWPTKETTAQGGKIVIPAPIHEFYNLVPFGQKGDFNWMPGNPNPTDANRDSVPRCKSSAHCENEQVQDGNIVGQGYTQNSVERKVENRLYFATGYLDTDGKTYVGSPLPMQNLAYEGTDPATYWQIAFIGKNTFNSTTQIVTQNGHDTSWGATMEAWWLMFFKVNEVLEGQAGMVSSSVYNKKTYLKNQRNDKVDLDNRVQQLTDAYNQWLTNTDFAKSLSDAIDLKVNLSIPSGGSFVNGEPFFNNNGDLVMPFDYF